MSHLFKVLLRLWDSPASESRPGGRALNLKKKKKKAFVSCTTNIQFLEDKITIKNDLRSAACVQIVCRKC